MGQVTAVSPLTERGFTYVRSVRELGAGNSPTFLLSRLETVIDQYPTEGERKWPIEKPRAVPLVEGLTLVHLVRLLGIVFVLRVPADTPGMRTFITALLISTAERAEEGFPMQGGGPPSPPPW